MHSLRERGRETEREREAHGPRDGGERVKDKERRGEACKEGSEGEPVQREGKGEAG